MKNWLIPVLVFVVMFSCKTTDVYIIENDFISRKLSIKVKLSMVETKNQTLLSTSNAEFKLRILKEICEVDSDIFLSSEDFHVVWMINAGDAAKGELKNSQINISRWCLL